MPGGHIVSEDELIRLGHRVLCIALAWYDWDELRRDDDPDPLDDLLRFDDEDFSTSLLVLASLSRALDDESNALGDAGRVLPEGVGKISSGGTKIVLTPREGCNKVIHARSRKIELSWETEHPIWNRWYQ